MRATQPTYLPKPKIEETRAKLKAAAADWDFFPPAARPKVVRTVTTAIDAYHKLLRPDVGERRSLEKEGLPILPSKKAPGRPPSAALDHLVSRLAHIYTSRTGKPPARSWSLAELTEFEKFVADVLRVAGADKPEKAATAAVTRHQQDMKHLPDVPDADGMIFYKILKLNKKK